MLASEIPHSSVSHKIHVEDVHEVVEDAILVDVVGHVTRAGVDPRSHANTSQNTSLGALKTTILQVEDFESCF